MFKNDTVIIMRFKNASLINVINILVCKSACITYILNTEFSDGVVHQYGEVLHRHPDVPVHPAAFFWPVLITFVLGRDA